MKDFNIPMMAMMEDIGSSEDQDSTFPMIHDSRMLTSHDHNPMGCHAITEDFQQNISRITGDSNGKGKSNITSFIAGNTKLRQNLGNLQEAAHVNGETIRGTEGTD